MTTIAFVHGISPIGGAERELLRYLDQLPQRRYRPIVICPEAGPLADAVRSRGLGWYPCRFPPWRKMSSFFTRRSSVDELRTVLQQSQPDLVHVNDIWWVPQTLRAVTELGSPVIAHVRQEIEPSKVLRYGLDRVDLVLAVSHHIEEAIRSAGVRGNHVRTLYSGLEVGGVVRDLSSDDVRRQYAIPLDAPLLGTVANLFPRKGYKVIIDALAHIVKSRPSVRYLIVGSGDEAYKRVLQAQVQKRSLVDHVRFAGFQADVSPYLSAMDLYVQPSLMEGFGVAVVEAMAMGKAVVVTRTGGLPEIVVHEETGLVVPPHDAVALAAAIEDLLKDSGKRARFGRGGQARVKTSFTIEAMMEGLISAYGAVVGSKVNLRPRVTS